jgi:hypothetical protein
VKFKIGDKVKIVSKERMEKILSLNEFSKERINFCGRNNLIITDFFGIRLISVIGNSPTNEEYEAFQYYLVEGDMYIKIKDWPEEMLELENIQLEFEL